MKVPLPEILRDALDQCPDGVEFEDSETQKVYYLTDAEFHRRAVVALQLQEDWEAIQQGLKERATGKGQPLAEVDAEIREEFGFPRRTQ